MDTKTPTHMTGGYTYQVEGAVQGGAAHGGDSRFSIYRIEVVVVDDAVLDLDGLIGLNPGSACQIVMRSDKHARLRRVLLRLRLGSVRESY